MQKLGLVIAVGARAVLGIGIALVFSTAAVVLARLIYLFFGLTAWNTWLAMLVVSGGIGAAAGGMVILGNAGPSSRTFKFPALVLLMAVAGIAGALGGFSFGDGRQVQCCARPDMGPAAYSTIGATLGVAGAGVFWGGLRIVWGLLKPFSSVNSYRDAGHDWLSG